LMAALLRVWWKHINATVLDENYLVGRKLVNSSELNKSTTVKS